jgi:hypothetical protein
MPICIAGMHRSGTSMVTRLLNLCGLYLGPETDLSASAFDNKAGFWENHHFVRLNEEVLAQLGGGWDLPPAMTEGWELRDEMAPLRQDAAALVSRFSGYDLWGWKDPRNSLTLAFWKRMIPDLKVVVCLRNPLEVAESLHQRSYSSYALCMDLWLKYYEQLLYTTEPAERVVTRYNTYFFSPQAELRRVLSLLKIPAPSETIEQACATISMQLRHNWVPTQELLEEKIPARVMDYYIRLCGEARAINPTPAEEGNLFAKSPSETGE